MKLSNEAVASFQKLYQEKCGIELEFEEAQVKALEELKRFALIYKPIQIKNLDIYEEFSSEKINK